MQLHHQLHQRKTIETLTEDDRINITILSRWYEKPITSRRFGNYVSLLKDTALLIDHGFTFGFSGDTMFGRDVEGRLWQVYSDQRLRGIGSPTYWRMNASGDAEYPKWVDRKGGIRTNDFLCMFKRKQL